MLGVESISVFPNSFWDERINSVERFEEPEAIAYGSVWTVDFGPEFELLKLLFCGVCRCFRFWGRRGRRAMVFRDVRFFKLPELGCWLSMQGFLTKACTPIFSTDKALEQFTFIRGRVCPYASDVAVDANNSTNASFGKLL